MTHLHFPDGILPFWLIVLGMVGAGLLVFRAVNLLQKDDQFAKKTSLIAMMAALMLIATSIPLGFIHFHMNLTVLVSLLIGPWFALLAAFVVNLFLSFIGHGGITVVGLNTLIFGAEIFLASFLFYRLRRLFSPRAALFSTVILALLVSTLLMLSTVALAALWVDITALSQYLEKGQQLSQGVAIWLFNLILPVVLVGATIEALVSNGIVQYLAKVKPHLVSHLKRSDEEDALHSSQHQKREEA